MKQFIVNTIEFLSFNKIRGQRPAQSLRWWWTPWTYRFHHGGWVCLSLSWFRRFSAAAFIAMLLCSCASTQVQTGSPLIKTAATVATTETLAQVKDTDKRTVDANYVYSVAVGLRTLSGTTPNVEDVEATLKTFGAPNDPQIAALISSLSTLYGSYYTQLATSKDGLKSAAIILEALAEGAEAGAAVYR